MSREARSVAAVKKFILLYFPDEGTWSDCPTRRVIPIKDRGNLAKGKWTPVIFNGKPTRGYIVEYSDDEDTIRKEMIALDDDDYLSTLPRSEEEIHEKRDRSTPTETLVGSATNTPAQTDAPRASTPLAPTDASDDQANTAVLPAQTDEQAVITASSGPGRTNEKEGEKTANKRRKKKQGQGEGDSATKKRKTTKPKNTPKTTRAGHYALIEVPGVNPYIVPLNQVVGWKTVELLQAVEFTYSNSKKHGKLIMTAPGENGRVLFYMRDKMKEGKENTQPTEKERTPKKSGHKQPARVLYRTGLRQHNAVGSEEVATNWLGGARANNLPTQTNSVIHPAESTSPLTSQTNNQNDPTESTSPLTSQTNTQNDPTESTSPLTSQTNTQNDPTESTSPLTSQISTQDNPDETTSSLTSQTNTQNDPTESTSPLTSQTNTQNDPTESTSPLTSQTNTQNDPTESTSPLTSQISTQDNPDETTSSLTSQTNTQNDPTESTSPLTSQTNTQNDPTESTSPLTSQISTQDNPDETTSSLTSQTSTQDDPAEFTPSHPPTASTPSSFNFDSDSDINLFPDSDLFFGDNSNEGDSFNMSTSTPDINTLIYNTNTAETPSDQLASYTFQLAQYTAQQVDQLWAVLATLSSVQPSVQPTFQPSVQPTFQPSVQPTFQPSVQPTFQPSVQPTFQPSVQPTFQPSVQPTFQPSVQPTSQPSVQPTSQPSVQPRKRGNGPKCKWLKPGEQRAELSGNTITHLLSNSNNPGHFAVNCAKLLFSGPELVSRNVRGIGTRALDQRKIGLIKSYVERHFPRQWRDEEDIWRSCRDRINGWGRHLKCNGVPEENDV
ncbi:uncharacterized protein LOC144870203 [Branchiostoma floridae x Branchiostoma japonicum]